MSALEQGETLQTKSHCVDGEHVPLKSEPPIALHTHGLGREKTHTQVLAQRQVFRREGEYWTVAYDGAVCRLRDTKVMQLLAHLLRCPGQRVPATQLLGGPREVVFREVAAAPTAPAGVQEAVPPDGAAAERARVNVTRAIKGALQKISVHHPALCAHLSSTVRTGNACVYLPDPRMPVQWETFSASTAFMATGWDEV